jgi:hypothetical protein
MDPGLPRKFALGTHEEWSSEGAPFEVSIFRALGQKLYTRGTRYALR